MEQNQNPQPPMFNQPSGQPQPNQQYQPMVRPVPMMEPVEAVKTCLRKFFDFTGRARRSEYWWFILFYLIVALVWIFLSSFFMAVGFEFSSVNEGPVKTMVKSSTLMLVPILIFIIPSYAAQTRRLHDSGHSGWWIVASFAVSLVYVISYYFALMKPILDSESAGRGFNENLSPTWMVVVGILSIISIVLSIVILVFTIQDSEPGENKYGPSPKYPGD